MEGVEGPQEDDPDSSSSEDEVGDPTDNAVHVPVQPPPPQDPVATTLPPPVKNIEK